MTAFIESKFSKVFKDNTIHLLGFPFDATSSYRAGSAKGPDSLREASENLETYSPYLQLDLQDLSLADLANLKTDQFETMIAEFEKLTKDCDLKKQKLITIGGEHSISIAPIKLHHKFYPDMLVLQLDAHADLRDEYLGNKNSHACIMRRCLDFLKTDQILQYGIRSGTKEEFKWMQENGTQADSLDELCQRLEKIKQPIYLTLDLDFFDPSELPGTGTPEAGGESFHSFIRIIKILAQKKLIGADITELSPNFDPTGRSSCLASKVVREMILALG
ncbi:agmatinase [Bacteriovoracaceae bacterium]|nr:agmatinase [Bacteriovoracaceae bacterium]